MTKDGVECEFRTNCESTDALKTVKLCQFSPHESMTTIQKKASNIIYFIVYHSYVPILVSYHAIYNMVIR